MLARDPTHHPASPKAPTRRRLRAPATPSIPDNNLTSHDPVFYVATDTAGRRIETYRGSDTHPKETFFHHQARVFGSGGGGPLLRTRNTLDQDHHKWATHAGSATHDERYYYATDSRGRPVALVSAEGKLVEQYRYSGNGMPFTLPKGDINGDGRVESKSGNIDSDQINYLAAQGVAYQARGDLDLDGDVDSIDVGIVIAEDSITGGRMVQSADAVGADLRWTRGSKPMRLPSPVLYNVAFVHADPCGNGDEGPGPDGSCPAAELVEAIGIDFGGCIFHPATCWGVVPPRRAVNFVGCPASANSVLADERIRRDCADSCRPITVTCKKCNGTPDSSTQGFTTPVPGSRGCSTVTICTDQLGGETIQQIINHELEHVLQFCRGQLPIPGIPPVGPPSPGWNWTCTQVIRAEWQAYRAGGQCRLRTNSYCCERVCGSAASFCGTASESDAIKRQRCLATCNRLYP